MIREEVLGRETTLRLECAVLAGGDINHALALYEFVTGRSDKTSRQKIESVLDEAGLK